MTDPTIPGPPFGSWPRAFAIAFALWTVPAAMDAVAFWIVAFGYGAAGGVLDAVRRAVFKWWLWAAITPGIWWLAGRVRLDGARRGRAILVHSLAGSVLAVAHLVAIALWATWASGGFDEPIGATIRFYVSSLFVIVFLAYWAMVAVAQMGRYHDLWRDRELRAARLEASLSRSRLEALQSQLHPHFLFNTLNGVIGLLRYGRTGEAIRMIGGLGSLLRRSLEAEEPLTSLADELDFVEEYLDIERVRLGDRLRVEFAIEPAALAATTPRLLLQAIVENAVRHGIAGRAEGGSVTIAAGREDGRVRIRVEDDGPGPAAGRVRASRGVGLENSRERLRHAWGSAWRLDLEAAPGGGARVTIEHPYLAHGADSGPVSAASGRPGAAPEPSAAVGEPTPPDPTGGVRPVWS